MGLIKLIINSQVCSDGKSRDSVKLHCLGLMPRDMLDMMASSLAGMIILLGKFPARS
jgi:hypothetical protein